MTDMPQMVAIYNGMGGGAAAAIAAIEFAAAIRIAPWSPRTAGCGRRADRRGLLHRFLRRLRQAAGGLLKKPSACRRRMSSTSCWRWRYRCWRAMIVVMAPAQPEHDRRCSSSPSR
jgi:hypothetical protein